MDSQQMEVVNYFNYAHTTPNDSNIQTFTTGRNYVTNQKYYEYCEKLSHRFPNLLFQENPTYTIIWKILQEQEILLGGVLDSWMIVKLVQL